MTKVEEVARAMYSADEGAIQWEELVEPLRENYRHLARAAIEALRIPSEGMVEAAWGAWLAEPSGGLDGMRRALEAAITAALGETDE